MTHAIISMELAGLQHIERSAHIIPGRHTADNLAGGHGGDRLGHTLSGQLRSSVSRTDVQVVPGKWLHVTTTMHAASGCAIGTR